LIDMRGEESVTTLLASFTTLPFAQLRKNRYFYFYYDGFYAALCVAAIALMKTFGHAGLVGEWHWSYMVVFPFVLYAGILCNVFVHVCTHNSLPRPWNRLVGELCGLVVLTRFASWEVLHQRHHRYSDDIEKDPHPVDPSYFKFVWHHVASLEATLHQTVFDLYGDTPENRRIEKIRSIVSFFTGVLVVMTWYFALGPIAFFGFYLPGVIVGVFHLVHFNWSTHNAFSPTRDFKPVNLNHGYYWLGNKLFFGIYMHANHHKRTNVLNPATITPSLPITPPPTKAEILAARTLAPGA
jgi:fatty acid desaturase